MSGTCRVLWKHFFFLEMKIVLLSGKTSYNIVEPHGGKARLIIISLLDWLMLNTDVRFPNCCFSQIRQQFNVAVHYFQRSKRSPTCNSMWSITAVNFTIWGAQKWIGFCVCVWVCVFQSAWALKRDEDCDWKRGKVTSGKVERRWSEMVGNCWNWEEQYGGR